jgi:two-component system KDP operon response regulator KdpE
MTGPDVEQSSPSGSRFGELSILMIEDDASVATVVSDALEARGYRVRVAPSGAEGLDAALADPPDVVLLDLGLPDIDGIAVCRTLRTWSSNPIVVLSADGAEDRKVAALDNGADDYVTKPFSMAELLARLRVAERHRHVLAATVDDMVIRVGDIAIDTAAHTVTTPAGDVLDLTRKEFALLAILARNAGRVLTHGVLLSRVWGRDARGTASRGTESLRVHVTHLRRKLGDGPRRPRIVSEPGTGYRLVLADDD